MGEPPPASGVQLRVIDVLLDHGAQNGADPKMLAALTGKKKV
jgi:hypothetical protein